MLTRLTERHLDDAALAELWTNATAGRSMVPAGTHLDACAECRVRYTAFDAWMNGLRDEATAEADDIFTHDRLAAQRAQIFRRLEASEQPTRIIAFPKAGAAVARPTPFRRWVAVAAAAGLIAGMALGQIFNLGRLSQEVPVRTGDRVIADAGRGVASNAAVVPAVYNEEVALRELDELANPTYEALRAFDTFTPRAVDYIQPR